MNHENIEEPISLSLDPYIGPWTKSQAAHLLKRTMMGPTNQQMLDAVTNGMNATVTQLLQIPAISDPLAFDAQETEVPLGSTWIGSNYPSNATQAQQVENVRIQSLAAWLMKRLNDQTVNISEKMCMFWQNHFSVSISPDARATYNYHMLIRQHAIGNFKQMIKDITVDPAMLVFLNGNSNTLYSPNENYGREFLELFTIGKGPQIGPGDYTNYTEQDVAAGAKIFTGYITDGFKSNTVQPSSIFTSFLHDSSTKNLSAHFNSQTISNNGANEYEDYVDVVFQQDQVAVFICSKLYRYFVNYDLTSNVMSTVVNDMAQIMVTNNYDIAPVLQALFTSQHFYDVSLKGAIIRNPLDMMYGMLNATGTAPNFNLSTDHQMYIYMYGVAQALGQSYAIPPSVAGWPAYYQAPSFSKLWINSTTIKTRFDISAAITVYTGINIGGNNLKINGLTFVNGLSQPDNATKVIDDIVDVFFPKGAALGDKLLLKNVLTNNLGDAEWQLQYNNYLADPGNTSLSDPIAARVNMVLSIVFKMPQFQTI